MCIRVYMCEKKHTGIPSPIFSFTEGSEVFGRQDLLTFDPGSLLVRQFQVRKLRTCLLNEVNEMKTNEAFCWTWKVLDTQTIRSNVLLPGNS